MKKAIKIVSIISIVTLVVTAIVSIILAIGARTNAQQLVDELLNQNNELNRQSAEMLVAQVSNFAIASGIQCAFGVITTIIALVKVDKDISKGTGIFIGIVNIIFSSVPVGVLYIIDSALHRNR